jgi:hypothetical protein
MRKAAPISIIWIGMDTPHSRAGSGWSENESASKSKETTAFAQGPEGYTVTAERGGIGVGAPVIKVDIVAINSSVTLENLLRAHEWSVVKYGLNWREMKERSVPKHGLPRPRMKGGLYGRTGPFPARRTRTAENRS